MNLLGPVAKGLAFLMGKQPEEQLHPRGFLGLELAETAGEVRVTRVLPDSPAARAGVMAGDHLVRLLDQNVTTLKALRAAASGVRAGDLVPIRVQRGPDALDLTLTAGEGL
jgi:S1-C subfamily serine protease